MKSIRKQNCILAIVMFALMSILTSFPVQAQTINQKQAKVTVQYASIPAKVETSSSGDIFITVKNISDDYRADYDMRVLNNKGNVVEVSEQNGGITYFSYLKKNVSAKRFLKADILSDTRDTDFGLSMGRGFYR